MDCFVKLKTTSSSRAARREAEDICAGLIEIGTIESGSQTAEIAVEAIKQGRALYVVGPEMIAGIVLLPPANARFTECWVEVHHPILWRFDAGIGLMCGMYAAPIFAALNDFTSGGMIDGFQTFIDKIVDANSRGAISSVAEKFGFELKPELCTYDKFCYRMPFNRIHIPARLMLPFVNAEREPSRGANGTSYFNTKAAGLLYSAGFGRTFLDAIADQGSALFGINPDGSGQKRADGCPG